MENIVPVAFFLFMLLAIIGFPIARAYARRIDRGESIPKEVTARLERMEQAIDSVAIEVERISEAQRFTTRLLADRTGAGIPMPGSGDIEQAR